MLQRGNAKASNGIDSNELGFVIRAILSIREQCALVNSHHPGKVRQSDIAADASWVNQGFEQGVIGLRMREINWFITNVRRGEFDPGW